MFPCVTRKTHVTFASRRVCNLCPCAFTNSCAIGKPCRYASRAIRAPSMNARPPPTPLKLCPGCGFAMPCGPTGKPSGSFRSLKILYSLEPAGTEWPGVLLWGTTPSGPPHTALARGKTHAADRVGPRGLEPTPTHACVYVCACMYVSMCACRCLCMCLGVRYPWSRGTVNAKRRCLRQARAGLISFPDFLRRADRC
jgi:hypothetical protein